MIVLDKENVNSRVLDKAGIVCSISCIFHCLLLPALAFLSPVFSSVAENEIGHYSLLAAIIPIVVITFYQQYRTHREIIPGLFAIGGLSVVLLALLLEDHHATGLSIDKVLTLLGSTLLIIAHVYNIKLSRNHVRES